MPPELAESFSSNEIRDQSGRLRRRKSDEPPFTFSSPPEFNTPMSVPESGHSSYLSNVSEESTDSKEEDDTMSQAYQAIYDSFHSREKKEVIPKTFDYFLRYSQQGVYTILLAHIHYAPPERHIRETYYHSVWLSLFEITDAPTDDELCTQTLLEEKSFRDKHGQGMPGELTLPLEVLLPIVKHEEN